MRLEWSRYALADRDEIFDYIEAESPRSAVEVDEAIGAQARRLLTYPESGRRGRVTNTRELVITGLPYIVVYRLSDGVVRILRVFHTARQWPEDMPQ